MKINSYLNKIQKKLKFLSKPKNVNKVLLLVGILLVLFVVHKYFLSKEGFESQPEELDENIAGQEKTAVLFYAEWCGHCKKFMPEWDKLSEEVNKTNENVKIMKVNCGDPKTKPEHKEIMKKHSIQGYPTIKIFKNGNEEEYDGDRSSSKIKQHLGI